MSECKDHERIVHLCAKEAEIERMSQQVDKIYKAFFEGNGKPSVMSQLAVHEATLKGMVAMGTILLVGLIGVWFKFGA